MSDQPPKNNKPRTKTKSKALDKTDIETIPTKPTINISAGDLAPICDMDHYDNWAKVAAKIWKQINPVEYAMCEAKAKLSGLSIASDGYYTKMQNIGKNAGNTEANTLINTIKQQVAHLNKSKDKSSIELTNKQAEITKSITQSQHLSVSEKRELEKLIKSATNTCHGVTNECNGYTIFNTHSGKQCSAQQKNVKFTLMETSHAKWVLTGRLDGLTPDNEVVEIKNRTKGLFGLVRDYEMMQIQSYIAICKSARGHLVELYKKSDGKIDYGIQTVECDTQFISDSVLPWIHKLDTYMYDIVNNSDSLKDAIVLGDPSKIARTQYYSFE